MHRRGRVIRGDAHRGFAGEEAEREGESEGGERDQWRNGERGVGGLKGEGNGQCPGTRGMRPMRCVWRMRSAGKKGGVSCARGRKKREKKERKKGKRKKGKKRKEKGKNGKRKRIPEIEGLGMG